MGTPSRNVHIRIGINEYSKLTKVSYGGGSPWYVLVADDCEGPGTAILVVIA